MCFLLSRITLSYVLQICIEECCSRMLERLTCISAGAATRLQRYMQLVEMGRSTVVIPLLALLLSWHFIGSHQWYCHIGFLDEADSCQKGAPSKHKRYSSACIQLLSKKTYEIAIGLQLQSICMPHTDQTQHQSGSLMRMRICFKVVGHSLSAPELLANTRQDMHSVQDPKVDRVSKDGPTCFRHWL